jgi:hypothetical protein
MQTKVTIILAGEEKPFRELSFSAFGLGAHDTLLSIADGVQVTADVSVTFDSLVVFSGTGRRFCAWVRNMEVAR